VWEGTGGFGRKLLGGRNRLLNIGGRSRKNRESLSLTEGRSATGRQKSKTGNDSRSELDAVFPKGERNDDHRNF
jgi:hypothetical protein